MEKKIKNQSRKDSRVGFKDPMIINKLGNNLLRAVLVLWFSDHGNSDSLLVLRIEYLTQIILTLLWNIDTKVIGLL